MLSKKCAICSKEGGGLEHVIIQYKDGCGKLYFHKNCLDSIVKNPEDYNNHSLSEANSIMRQFTREKETREAYIDNLKRMASL